VSARSVSVLATGPAVNHHSLYTCVVTRVCAKHTNIGVMTTCFRARDLATRALFAPNRRIDHYGAMNEETWRKWAEQMTTGLAFVDAGLRLQWINPALAECLALGPRSAIGQPLTALLADAAAAEQSAAVLAEQRPLQWRGATSPLSATLRGFAHEVKNPLAGLRGAAQLLQRRVDGADLKSLAGLIIDEADRLGGLANRLLYNDGVPKLGPVNIHHLLERLTDLLQAEPSAPRLRHDYDPSMPDLHADADRLQQVLLNLARNAREAGASTLTLRTRVEHGLRLGERVLRMALRLDLIDNGAGVPAELRDTLFQPLVSGRADGSGLGLALSREIAHEHGGELRYVSRPGETVFSLYLPLEKAHD
jgi:two-component system nitrogen regulation sensor histidine kinase GlnL